MSTQKTKIGKRAASLVSFLFGVGILVTGLGVGLALPTAVKLALKHSRLIVDALMIFLLVVLIQTLGKPLQKILSGHGEL